MNELWSDQQGQSVIEVVLAMNVIVLVIAGALSLAYLCFAKLTLQHLTHETLVCHIREASPEFCKKNARIAMKQILFFGELKSLQTQSDTKYLTGEVEWNLKSPFRQITLKHRHKLLKTIISPSKRTTRALLW